MPMAERARRQERAKAGEVGPDKGEEHVTPLARRVSHARESSGLCTFPLENSGT